MPITRTTIVAGVNVEDAGLVRFQWGGYTLPVPPPDVSSRQVLDFAAVVALDGRGSSGTWDMAGLVGRAVEAYRREYIREPAGQ